jgi:hypothetical protein
VSKLSRPFHSVAVQCHVNINKRRSLSATDQCFEQEPISILFANPYYGAVNILERIALKSKTPVVRGRGRGLITERRSVDLCQGMGSSHPRMVPQPSLDLADNREAIQVDIVTLSCRKGVRN